MTRIIMLLFICLSLAWAQTSTTFTLPLRSKTTGQLVPGKDVDLYQSGVKKYDLTETSPGVYSNSAVATGKYDVYVNGSPLSGWQGVWHGSDKLTSMEGHANSSGQIGTSGIQDGVITLDKLSSTVRAQLNGSGPVRPPDDKTVEYKISGTDTTVGIKNEWDGKVRIVDYVKGDGVTDDTQGLRNALKKMSINAELVGDKITCLVSDTLFIKYSGLYRFNGLKIVVDTSKFFPDNNDLSNVITIDANTDNVTLSGLEIDGKYGTKRGIYVKGNNDNIFIEHCTLSGTGQAIRFNGGSNLNVLYNTISDNTTFSLGAYFLTDESGIDGVNVIGNVIESAQPIYCGSLGNTNNARNGIIEGNKIKFPAPLVGLVNTEGITWTANGRVTIRSNWVGDSLISTSGFNLGISVQGDTMGRGEITVDDNKVYWSRTTHLELYDATKSKVTKNIFSSDSANMVVRNPVDMLVSGNTFRASQVKRVDSTPTVRHVNIIGSKNPTGFKVNRPIGKIRIVNNSFYGGETAVHVTPDTLLSSIIISNNDAEYIESFFLTAGTGRQFDNINISGNIIKNLKNTIFKTANGVKWFTFVTNQVEFDTSGVVSTPSTAAFDFAGFNRAIIGNNIIDGGGKDRLFKSTGSINYGTITSNVFENFGSRGLSDVTGAVDTSNNIWTYDLPVQTNIVGWWVSNDLNKINGDSVITWPSRLVVNPAYTYVDSTNTRPIYKTNVLNGFPAVHFDGINDILTTKTSMFHQTTPKTVFVVMKNQGTTTQGIVGNMRRGESGNIPWGQGLELRATDTLTVVSTANGGSPGFSIKTEVTADPMLISAVLKNAGTILRANGAQVGSNTTDNLQASYSYTTIGGSDHNAKVTPDPGKYFSGDILEIVVYNVELTTQQISDTEKYFNDKYKIY